MDNTLTGLIDQMATLRGQKKETEYALKGINQSIESLERQMIEILDDNGLVETKNSLAKISIRESVHAHVEDWEQLWDYIIENRYTHLMQRRASDTAYREILNMGDSLPGVVPFTKRKIAFKEN